MPPAPISAPVEPLLILKGIGKSYPIFRTHASRLRTILELLTGRSVNSVHHALSGIELNIGRGESLGVIGENGAGKSTLLKIIAGVAKPSEGTRIVTGRLSALLELGTGFHPEYSGRDNIFLAAALMGWSKSETHAILDQVLEFADIGEQINDPIKTYSTGMVVRLGFAVATSLKPDILVTDEVLAVGDESYQKKCLNWMKSYRASGGALLLCSHSMYHVQSLCEQALWIDHGRERMRGDAYAVTQAYLAYHEEKSRNDAEQHVRAPAGSPYPLMIDLWASDSEGRVDTNFPMGTDIVLNGIYRAPDDSPVPVMVGMAKADLTPVFGTLSTDAGFQCNRVAPQLFAFRFVIERTALLPGRYEMRGHTLDEHGLRMYDTMTIVVTVMGRTRDHGLVRIAHRWESGEERRPDARRTPS